MTRDRFGEIMKEYDYTEEQIEALWSHPRRPDYMNEDALRATAEFMKPLAIELRWVFAKPS